MVHLISARKLAVLCAFIGSGCNLHSENMFNLESGKIDGFSYEALWREENGKAEIRQLVFFPAYSTYNLDATPGFGSAVPKRGVAMMPEGLFVNGKQVPTSRMSCVFVYSPGGVMKAIPLSEHELMEFGPDSFRNTHLKDVWKTKIKPAVVAASWAPPPEHSADDRHH